MVAVGVRGGKRGENLPQYWEMREEGGGEVRRLNIGGKCLIDLRVTEQPWQTGSSG